MKRIILSAMVLAFAVAVQAGDAKPAPAKDKDMSGCCSSKVKTSTEAKGTCPFAQAACCKKTAVKQTVLMSPKAADLVR